MSGITFASSLCLMLFAKWDGRVTRLGTPRVQWIQRGESVKIIIEKGNTGNLNKHIQCCRHRYSTAAQKLNCSPKKPDPKLKKEQLAFNPVEFHKTFGLFIVTANISLNSIENEFLQHSISLLRPGFVLPSATTLRVDISRLYKIGRDGLMDELKNFQEKIHLLRFPRLLGRHSAVPSSPVIWNLLRSRGILERLVLVSVSGAIVRTPRRREAFSTIAKLSLPPPITTLLPEHPRNCLDWASSIYKEQALQILCRKNDFRRYELTDWEQIMLETLLKEILNETEPTLPFIYVAYSTLIAHFRHVLAMGRPAELEWDSTLKECAVKMAARLEEDWTYYKKNKNVLLAAYLHPSIRSTFLQNEQMFTHAGAVEGLCSTLLSPVTKLNSLFPQLSNSDILGLEPYEKDNSILLWYKLGGYSRKEQDQEQMQHFQTVSSGRATLSSKTIQQ
ncbi:hypothetical protein BT69DRAFT_1292355 [Atractiella rhizophila]|nr:hypothetical protein BT69DRAFT_1292355 [Atractiella rhizophila]